MSLNFGRIIYGVYLHEKKETETDRHNPLGHELSLKKALSPRSMLFGNDRLLAISRRDLTMGLVRLYGRAPKKQPKNGPKMYTHNPWYFPCTIAGPNVLTFVEAPEIGLNLHGKKEQEQLKERYKSNRSYRYKLNFRDYPAIKPFSATVGPRAIAAEYPICKCCHQ